MYVGRIPKERNKFSITKQLDIVWAENKQIYQRKTAECESKCQVEGIRNRKLEMINQNPAEKCSFLTFFIFPDHAKKYSFILMWKIWTTLFRNKVNRDHRIQKHCRNLYEGHQSYFCFSNVYTLDPISCHLWLPSICFLLVHIFRPFGCFNRF